MSLPRQRRSSARSRGSAGPRASPTRTSARSGCAGERCTRGIDRWLSSVGWSLVFLTHYSWSAAARWPPRRPCWVSPTKPSRPVRRPAGQLTQRGAFFTHSCIRGNGLVCRAEANPYAVADDEGGGADGAADGLFAPPVPSQLQLEVPPFEDQLMQGTLWAEVEKLYGARDGIRRRRAGIHAGRLAPQSQCRHPRRYGHPSEIITVAVNRAGTLAASACKVRRSRKRVRCRRTMPHGCRQKRPRLFRVPVGVQAGAGDHPAVERRGLDGGGRAAGALAHRDAARVQRRRPVAAQRLARPELLPL